MKSISAADDIKPVSEFRSNAKALIAQVRNTKRPLVITQNGRSAAVLLDVAEYQKMVDMLEVQADIQSAEDDIVNNRTHSSKSARSMVLKHLAE